MDILKTLGTILDKNETRRDAVHVAIMPVTAAEDGLRSGDHVNFVFGSTELVKRSEPCYGLPAVGVIDPFLRERYLKKGQRAWLFLYPGTVTGMRHEWTCPAVDKPAKTANEHEQWLREFADRWNMDYDKMVSEAKAGGYVVARGQDLHSASELAGDEDLFWQHMEGLTGKTFDHDHRRGFGWSCSC